MFHQVPYGTSSYKTETFIKVKQIYREQYFCVIVIWSGFVVIILQIYEAAYVERV